MPSKCSLRKYGPEITLYVEFFDAVVVEGLILLITFIYGTLQTSFLLGQVKLFGGSGGCKKNYFNILFITICILHQSDPPIAVIITCSIFIGRNFVKTYFWICCLTKIKSTCQVVVIHTSFITSLISWHWTTLVVAACTRNSFSMFILTSLFITK